MDERTRMKMKIVMMNRWDIRTLFGITFADQWGHFTDQWMSPIVHSYSDWIDYPKGNHELKDHIKSAICVVVSSDGSRLFAGFYDHSIMVWKLTSNELIEQWSAHAKAVQSLAYHRSGSLVSGSLDGRVRVWNPFSFALIHSLEGHTTEVESVAISTRGNRIASASRDGSIRVWTLPSGEPWRQLSGHSRAVQSVCFAQAGSLVISASRDRSLRVWDVSEGQLRQTVTDPSQCVESASLNCDASLLACFRVMNLMVQSWPEMTSVCEMKVTTTRGCFHPSNPDILAVCDNHGNLIRIMNARNGDVLRTLEGPSKLILSVCFTPDGTRLISASRDIVSLRIWDLSGLF